MKIYFAKIVEINGYNNLAPIFEIVEGELIEKDFKEEFPTTGMITITNDTKYYGNVVSKNYLIWCLDDKNLYKHRDPSDVEEGKKFNCYQLFDALLDEDSELPDEFDLYEVFEMPSYLNIDKLRNNPIFSLVGKNITPLSASIYINDNNYLYGPFNWIKNDKNTLLLRGLDDDKTNYFIKKYKLCDLTDVLYEFDDEDKFVKNIRKIIYTDDLKIDYSLIDFINEKELKNEFLKATEEFNSSIDAEELKRIVIEMPSLKATNSRKEKLIEIFSNYKDLKNILEEVAVSTIKNPKTEKMVLEEILSNSETKDRVFEEIKDRKDLNSKLNDAEDEIETKKNEKIELENEIFDLQKKKEKLNTQEIIEIKSEEIKKLNEQKQMLQDKIQEFGKKNDLSKEINDWYNKVEEAKETHNSYTNINKDLETELKNKVNNAYIDVAFNGTIANQIFKAAAKYSKSDEENKHFEMMSRIESISNIKDEFENVQDLIDYVNKKLNNDCNRKISRNDVTNILLCISQGFLTVFAGEPGSGKTSLCNYLSKIMGINRDDKYSRYIEVSVEKGWMSKRDFIGYYNPITKAFDKANNKIFEAFNILNKECENKINDFPFAILLDEANLSPMEHYWADFMNVCDFQKSRREINLNEQYMLKIPPTLRFLATINYDHTTEILSPRLIDRAWIILLENNNLDINEIRTEKEIETMPIIGYRQLKSFFCVNSDKSLENSIRDKFNEINNCLRKNGIFISPRVMEMIKNYCVVGHGLFDKTVNKYTALDYAVAQKILPMINGFGEVYNLFLENLKIICDKNNMPISNKILEKIIYKGSINMQYYQFFAK